MLVLVLVLVLLLLLLLLLLLVAGAANRARFLLGCVCPIVPRVVALPSPVLTVCRGACCNSLCAAPPPP